MNSIDVDALLFELNARLPELEWKISQLSASLTARNIPRGLFNLGSEITPKSCVEEIKQDIYSLTHQKNERSAFYLAERIRRKVNVLVTLCKMDGRHTKVDKKVGFGVTMLSTRQQWIKSLEQEVTTLTMQYEAMHKSLEHLKRSGNLEAIMSLQGELGEVDRRLTLAREALTRVVL